MKELLEVDPRAGTAPRGVTRGAQGAAAVSREAYVEVPGLAVEVVDTVGAGDTFGAALLAALIDADAFGPVATTPLDTTLLRRSVSYAVMRLRSPAPEPAPILPRGARSPPDSRNTREALSRNRADRRVQRTSGTESWS